MHSIPEKDWKIFRELHAVAVDRFCQGILDEVSNVCRATKGTARERYFSLYKLIERRDNEIARNFDDLRRSTAPACILNIYALGIWTEEEFARFSLEIRAFCEQFGRAAGKTAGVSR